MLDFLMNLEDGFLDVLGIHLLIVGELCDHQVTGVESPFHHPLTLENLRLHCFESCLHASGLLWPLNITDVQHPLMHLNGLRVLQHLRKVGVDDLLGELVLAGTLRSHGDLVCQKNSSKQRQEIFA